MIYEEPKEVNRNEVLKKFSSGESNEICNALVSMAFYDEDWKWSQDQCLNFLEHSDSNVRGVAATCLGHIARIHQFIERERVENALTLHLKDKEISGTVMNALSDIKMFVS
ncbi:MAG: hypothetical protein H0V82_02335 [Candidatus Protochlamydia sp.]|nr:hypothetical protein [Candidatus Protochlamydia sp.]